MTDHDEIERQDVAECPACKGMGSRSVFAGDEELLSRCEDCQGEGFQLSREDFLRVAAQADGDSDDLRLVPEAVEPEWDSSAYANHGEEVAAALREHRRAS